MTTRSKVARKARTRSTRIEGEAEVRGRKVSAEELALINRARWSIGLPPLVVKTRNCLACGKPFETIERRTCGCKADVFDWGAA